MLFVLVFAQDETDHICYILCLVYFVNRTKWTRLPNVVLYGSTEKVEPCGTEQ